MLMPLSPEIENCQFFLDVVVPRMREEEKHGRVDFNNYWKLQPCGTAYCAAGWLLVLKDGWTDNDMEIAFRQFGDHIERAASELIGTYEDEWLCKEIFGFAVEDDIQDDIDYREKLVRKHMEEMIAAKIAA